MDQKGIRIGFSGMLAVVMLVVIIGASGCERKIRPIPEMKKGVWFIADQLPLALRFDEMGPVIKGQYVITDHAISRVFPFEAVFKRGKLVFEFMSHPDIRMKGAVTTTEDGYAITGKRGKVILLKAISTAPPHRFPGRFGKVITDKITRTEVTYGYASGYYASRPVADMSSGKYPEIVLGVLSEVTANMFSDSIRLDMDVYRPATDTLKARPVIVYMHGGAFIVGDKRDDFPVRLARYYAQCGYVVVSLNYRMGFIVVPGVAAQLERAMYRGIQDVRAAVRFMVQHKERFGVDPNQIFLAGNSAGGFYALLTTFMQEDEKWQSAGSGVLGLRKELGCLDCSTNPFASKFKVAGVVNLWGGITDLSLIDADEKVPVYMVHGTADKIVPYHYDYPFSKINSRLTSLFTTKVHGSKPVYDWMKQLGFDVTLKTIPKGNHEPQDDDTATFFGIREEITSFFYRTISGPDLEIMGPDVVSHTSKPARYLLLNHNQQQVRWACKGGLILRHDETGVDVVWFDHQELKLITATAMNSIGVVRKVEKAVAISR